MRSPWNFVGDGRTTEFALPGRRSANPKAFDVRVGGVPQPVTAFSLPKGEAVIRFTAPPPAGEAVTILHVGA